MKRYKFFCILSIVLFCSVSNSLFSMQNKKLELYERFKEIKNKEVNLSNIDCRIISSCGKYMVSGGYDGEVVFWDIKNNEARCSYTYGHNGWVRCVSFSPDSRYLVSGGDDGKVIVYDIENKQEVFSYSHNDFVHCVSFSPDGDMIISSDVKDKVIVFNISCEFYLGQKLYELNEQEKKKIKNRLVKQKNKKHRCDVAIVCES